MVDLDELLADIARRHMRFETLQPRGRDSLDFRDVSVRGARDALQEAYEAGRAAGAREKSPAAP